MIKIVDVGFEIGFDYMYIWYVFSFSLNKNRRMVIYKIV